MTDSTSASASDADRTALYRLYDASECLLYIGITDNPQRRFTQHSQSQPWWPDVARTTWDWLPSRAEALSAEEAAITAEKPKHNRPHRKWPIPPQRTDHTERGGPKYRQIADSLRSRIINGEFAVGERLPTMEALKAEYGAAINTVDRAIDELRQEGRAETVQGSGTFAREPKEPPRSREYMELWRRLEMVQEEMRRLEARLDGLGLRPAS